MKIKILILGVLIIGLAVVSAEAKITGGFGSYSGNGPTIGSVLNLNDFNLLEMKNGYYNFQGVQQGDVIELKPMQDKLIRAFMPSFELDATQASTLLEIIKENVSESKYTEIIETLEDFGVSFDENGAVESIPEEVSLNLNLFPLKDGDGYNFTFGVVKEGEGEASGALLLGYKDDEAFSLSDEQLEELGIDVDELAKRVINREPIAAPEDGTMEASEAVELVDQLINKLKESIENIDLTQTLEEIVNAGDLETLVKLMRFITLKDKLEGLKAKLEELDPDTEIKVAAYEKGFGFGPYEKLGPEAIALEFQYEDEEGNKVIDTVVTLSGSGVEELLKTEEISWESVLNLIKEGEYDIVNVFDRLELRMIKAGPIPIEDLEIPD